MAVDTTPADSARSLLNGIDYAALIGGPLQAAITAQAMAANSTWEFIQQVGLNPKDANGNRSAINVSFLYQRDGEMVKLVVPILVIVPIPLIVVDEIAIDFTAKINASASSTSQQASTENVSGEVAASGRVGWGPFSLNASFKASYAKNQTSSASQDSRYAVEYTQNVRVHARQADMPDGLRTILNILSSAATGGTAHGSLTVSPQSATINLGAPDAVQVFQITSLDSSGLKNKATVTVGINDRFVGLLAFSNATTGQPLTPTGTGTSTFTIDTAKGSFALAVKASSNPGNVPAGWPYPSLSFTTKMAGSGDSVDASVPITFAAALPAGPLT